MTQPQNLTIIWDNRKFDAAVLTASSAAAGYPVACLQDSRQSRTFRTDSLNNQSVIIDFGEPVTPTCLALANHNFSVNVNPDGTYQAQIRVQASDNPAFGTLLKNDIYDAWTEIIGYGEGGYGGAILESDRRYLVPRPIRVIYFEPPEGATDHVSARYWRLLPVDPGNSDGFFEIGRIFLGLYDEYADQFEYGWVFGYQDNTAVSRSLGGTAWKDRREPYRVLSLPWSVFDDQDKYWRLAFFLQKVGLWQEFVIDCFPASRPSQRHFNLVYALVSSNNASTLGSLPALTAKSYNLSELTIVIEESL